MLPFPQQVMLSRAVDRLPRSEELPGGCAYEPKWDGYRSLLFVGENGCRVQSRRGSDLTRSFPEIVAAAEAQLPPDTVLDGELVVWGTEALDFPALQRRVVAPGRAARLAAEQPATLLAFDVLEHRKADLRREPMAVRRSALEELGKGLSPPIQVTPQTMHRETAQQWLDQYASSNVGVEGLVVKGLRQPYLPGRREWLKLRLRDTVTVLVGAVTGPIERPERLVLGLPDESGELVVAGGTAPLRPPQRREVASLLRPPEGPHPWPDDLPAGRMGSFGGGRVAVTLVEPSLVVEVSADKSFEHGKWRHLTRLVRLRPDLSPAEVERAPTGGSPP